ncbi:hypothetical protein ELQ35_01580 [Peribacillus cavernae]|uniref:Divalent metal cation transporter n=1 Tax=Peribacillus cavernae TaxID=1674310 RepID=A0A3S0VU48_9BACI|nr:divalent metal cation transporter [Peribacillus cavernae]MDQ0218032.1 Mn2+/Fe2+ NRAMP family transporter [Peribacillus cavernae]RUQ32802.1 hypothetical protein ELQ35_01580 [Peribacillus cavernae]
MNNAQEKKVNVDRLEYSQTNETNPPNELPTTFGDIIKSLGPGIVIAMAFLGTADLVSSAVSGTNYGYALIWTVIVGLAARYFMVSAIAKYTLQNKFGDVSILQGYKRVWKGFPMLLGILTLFYAIILMMAMVRFCSVALYNLFGQTGGSTWGYFIWGSVTVGISLYMLSRPNAFKILEWCAKIASIAIILTFVFALFKIGTIDVIGLIKGLGFGLPPNNGAFDAVFIAVATIGTVGGSVLNLTYPYFMEEKGWKGPKYRKLQTIDLLSGLLPVLLIMILIWIVAAETMRGSGITISNEQDLALMMEMAVGPSGPSLLWICVFLTAFTSFPSAANGLIKIVFDGFHLNTKRGESFKKADEDPLFNKVIILLTLFTLLITVPNAPNLVYISIFGSVLTTVMVPPIILGITIMTSSKKYMLPDKANRWWEFGILFILMGVGFWSVYEIIVNLIARITG